MNWLWIIGIILLALTLWVTFRPIPISGLVSHPNPVTSYEEALARVKAMQEEDNQDMAQDVCITKLFDHGLQTENVIILLHGFTNCPEQFSELGKQFFDEGFNVFIPRQPYHGLSDRLTNQLEKLTAEELCIFGDKVLNIAHGLGKKVAVMGISGGGNVAAWLAQNRSDLDAVFPISPLLGLASIPSWRLTRFLIRLGLVIPNFYMWWDPKTKTENPHAIYYAYPGYPIRSMMEIFRLGVGIQTQAEQNPIAAKGATMIINDDEPSVSNTEIVKLLTTWQKHGKGILNEYHLEKNIQLPHDFITPGVHDFPQEAIYARLVKAVQKVAKKIKDETK